MLPIATNLPSGEIANLHSPDGRDKSACSSVRKMSKLVPETTRMPDVRETDIMLPDFGTKRIAYIWLVCRWLSLLTSFWSVRDHSLRSPFLCPEANTVSIALISRAIGVEAVLLFLGVFDLRSQNLIVLSCPTERSYLRSSDVKTQAVTKPLWPVSVPVTCKPPLTEMRLMLLRLSPAASTDPLLLKLRQDM